MVKKATVKKVKVAVKKTVKKIKDSCCGGQDCGGSCCGGNCRN